MKHNKLLIGLILVFGMGVIIFFSKKDLLNAYFSTTKLKFLEGYFKSNYLYEVNAEEGMEGVFAGYLEAVDNRGTYYLKKNELKKAQIQEDGDYYGTGLELMWSADGNSIEVVNVIKESNAEQAGIKKGDLITEIGGIKTLPANRYDISKKLYEHSDSPLSFIIGKDSDTKEVLVKEGKVSLEDVQVKTIAHVVNIKIKTVKDGTSERLEEILKQVDFNNIKGMILDIRDLYTDNIEEISKISNLFLKSGVAFKIQTKGEQVKSYEMNEKNYRIPDVVMINGGTLGGGEALALALKDHVTFVGSDSGGFAYIKKIIDLEDGTGMSVAIGKICDRYGKQLDEDGIIPDVRVYLQNEAEADETYLKAAMKCLQ